MHNDAEVIDIDGILRIVVGVSLIVIAGTLLVGNNFLVGKAYVYIAPSLIAFAFITALLSQRIVSIPLAKTIRNISTVKRSFFLICIFGAYATSRFALTSTQNRVTEILLINLIYILILLAVVQNSGHILKYVLAIAFASTILLLTGVELLTSTIAITSVTGIMLLGDGFWKLRRHLME